MISADLAARLDVLPPVFRPEPVQEQARVVSHETAARDHRRLVLHSPAIARAALPGQFVMLTVPESLGYHALPRPMAVHRTEEDLFEVIYRIKGEGTAALARLQPHDTLRVVGPLGHPFDVPDRVKHAMLIARGIGVCSLALLVPQLRRSGARVTAVVSARDPGVLVGDRDLIELGANEVLTVLDADGTSDVAALETTLRQRGPADFLAVCGSRRLTDMTGRLSAAWGAPAQVSVEAHMACGMGYCHGCASAPQTRAVESPLVCVDGPVFGLRGEENT